MTIHANGWVASLVLAVSVGAAAEPIALKLQEAIYAQDTLGDLDKAIRLYGQITSEAQVARPLAAEAYLRLGTCWHAQGEDGRARAALETVAEQYPEQRGLVERAAAALQALGGLTESQAETLDKEGWSLWQQQRFAEAEAKFKAALEADPELVSALNGLGWAQFNQGKRSEAQEAFEACLERDPDHAAALNGLGWLAKAAGNTDDALAFWHKAVEAAPNATAALSGLAQTYTELGQYDKAMFHAKQWLEAEPQSEQAQLLLKTAEAHRAAAQAAALQQKESAAGREDESALGARRDAAIQAGKLLEAVDWEMKRVVLRAEKRNPWKDKIDLASTYARYTAMHKLSNTEVQALMKQVEAYAADHSGNPDYAWRCYHLLAAMALDREDADAAAAWLNKALEAYPAVDYPDPSKHSKYHHLVNERAGLLWDAQGADAAEAYFLERLETDPKCQHAFLPWWADQYKARGAEARFPAFETAVKAALAARN